MYNMTTRMDNYVNPTTDGVLSWCPQLNPTIRGSRELETRTA
jgi:hypothetical protein